MRNDESGPAVHQLLDRLHDRRLSRGVECGSGFVEEEDRRVLEKGAGDSEALTLSDAQVSAAFANRAVVSVRHAANEILRLRAPRRVADLGFGRARPAVSDVLAHGGGEENGVLEDDRDLGAERFLRDLPHIAPVQPNDSGVGIVKTRDEAKKSALTRAGASDKGEDLIGRNLQVEVMQDRMLLIVTEADLLEGNCRPGYWKSRPRRANRAHRLRDRALRSNDARQPSRLPSPKQCR